MEQKKRTIIIGGGAAGYFAAISAATNYPDSEVLVLEKGQNVLGKVKVSGGGRCNVTNAAKSIKELSLGYPRGEKLLKNLFKEFNNKDVVNWFESRNVLLKAEPDDRIFPISNSSQSIIDCLEKELKKLKIRLIKGNGVTKIWKDELHFWQIETLQFEVYSCNNLIIATGGNQNTNAYKWIENLGIKVEPPVPSLFTFNCPESYLKPLMGVASTDAKVKIVGQSFNFQGPLLITHWGFSGPAILKLSSFAAKVLASLNYQFQISINWLPKNSENNLRNEFEKLKQTNPKKLIINSVPEGIPTRLWLALCQKSEISNIQNWSDLNKIKLNKLIELLINSIFDISGKTTFKEEFVTCGGVSLQEINQTSLESIRHKDLYFAGEVLDIDGITGGYNFQAAWTTAWKSGQLGNKNNIIKY